LAMDSGKGKVAMNCKEIQEKMLDVAAGMIPATGEEGKHLAACGDCAGKLDQLRRTMSLLDEWQEPEPSAYFDVRLQARLREEAAKPQAGWLQWFRRPALAAALTVVLAGGAGFFIKNGGWMYNSAPTPSMATNFGAVEPGTAVSDLQALEKNHELYADFELLDDLQVQDDVLANP
jgi:hypothetical protein